MDSQVAWLVNEATNTLLSGEAPVRHGSARPNIVLYQVFKAIDGHVIVAVGNDGQFARFCAILGCPCLAEDLRHASNEARLRNRASLIPILSDRLAEMEKAPCWRRWSRRTFRGTDQHRTRSA